MPLTVILVIAVLFTVTACASGVPSSHTSDGETDPQSNIQISSGSSVEMTELEKQIKEVADAKARTVGIDPDQTSSRVWKEPDGWRVEYVPQRSSQPNTVMMGGGLIIYLNDDGTVTKVLRGQ